MPILFSAVAKKQKVLANFASCDGNFIEIALEVLSKLGKSDRLTYYHGPYLIHYILEDKYLYFCITDKVSILSLTGFQILSMNFVFPELYLKTSVALELATHAMDPFSSYSNTFFLYSINFIFST